MKLRAGMNTADEPRVIGQKRPGFAIENTSDLILRTLAERSQIFPHDGVDTREGLVRG
jgi:hypothetical protein